MTPAATLFRTILTGLRGVIAALAARDRARQPLLLRIHQHIGHTIARFERLFAHWQNNTLPQLRAPRPGRPSRPRGLAPLPTGPAWLLRHVDHYDARGFASQLQHLLHTEDCARFLAEVPRTARILRPLARALAIQLPGDPPPPLPKPVRTPKPPRTRWPPLPPRPWSDPAILPLEFSKAR